MRIDSDEIIRKASKYDYWFFSHHLGDGKRIDATEEKYRTMHAKKIDHILSPAIDLICGGSLKGLTVLDCGCNSGLFSFECARRGAEHVLGLEGKNEFLEQAEMLRDYYGYTNVEFKKMDLAKLHADDIRQFDIVLLMGVIYYLENPIAFLREIYKIVNKAIVIDSETIFLEDALFHVRLQGNPPNIFGGLTEARLLPSVGAIKAMLYISEFKSFRILDSDKVGKEYTNCRIALVASKTKEDNFEALHDRPFVLHNKLGRILPSEYTPIEK